MPYGTLGMTMFLEEDKAFPATQVDLRGASGATWTYDGVTVGPALWLLCAFPDAAGRLRRRLTVVGGTGYIGAVDPLGVGNVPFSRLLVCVPGLPDLDVLIATAAGAAPERIGTLVNQVGGDLPQVTLPSAAVGAFRLVLRVAGAATVVYDSGVRIKYSNTLLTLAPPVAGSTGWRVLAVEEDANRGVKEWAPA